MAFATTLPICTNDFLPGHGPHFPAEAVVYQNGSDLSLLSTAFILTSGKRNAVLIDAPATEAYDKRIPDWIITTIPYEMSPGDICHPWPRRPLLCNSQHSSAVFSGVGDLATPGTATYPLQS